MLKANEAPLPRWHWYALGAVALIALWVRLYYVHTAVVDHPLRGDTRQYFAYALNLVDHHVFSSVAPGQGIPLPDTFRDPGYPAFLALLVMLFGREQGFYGATLDVQAVLSAATVVIYMVLARRWMGVRAALVVGLGMAFWPHAITLAGVVLSETLMGFLVASGLLLLELALARPSTSGAIEAGGLFALAALTNATLAPAVPLFALIAAWRDASRRRFWTTLLLAAMLPLGAWALRGAGLPADQSAGNRVAMNFVQGSWPEYHRAWIAAINGDNAATETMARIDGEYSLLQANRADGMRVIRERLAANPARYVAWYASKPAELWGWSIGIGDGDIYVFPTIHSPLSSAGLLKASTDLLFLIHPLLLILAIGGLAATLLTPHRHPALLAAAIIAMTITAICTVLQADARYSTPYRGIEWVLIVAGGLSLWQLRGKTRA